MSIRAVQNGNKNPDSMDRNMEPGMANVCRLQIPSKKPMKTSLSLQLPLIIIFITKINNNDHVHLQNVDDKHPRKHFNVILILVSIQNTA
jgi:hypothetical protein